MNKVDFVKQGKRNRAAGARFEKKVREDLESKGWIVSKWQNNVELAKENSVEVSGIHDGEKFIYGKCIPAKPGRFRMMQTGFPDFVGYRRVFKTKKIDFGDSEKIPLYIVVFYECKTNGYLSKEEKMKAKWYLENGYCSKFFVAKKKKVGRKVEVEYNEFT